MPFLVPIFIAAVASELGVGAIIATAITDVIGTSLVGTIVADAVAGAVVGAAAGAAGAAAAGTDPGDGALWGAASGGLGGGLTPAIGAAADAAGNPISDSLSQALAQGAATTGVSAARGADPATALEYGAAAGAGSYAGNQLFNPSDPSSAPDPAGPSAPGTPGTEAVTVTGQAAAPSLTAGVLPPAPNDKPEEVTVTGQRPAITNFAPGISGTGVESVEVTGQRPSNATTEAVTVTGNKAAPSILDLIQSDKGVQSIEKGALTTALFQLLFPQGGGQFAGGGGTAAAPGSAPGGTSPAASAAVAAQTGQAGSSSAYAPGGPIVGDPTGATKSSPWNVESLRTTQGVS